MLRPLLLLATLVLAAGTALAADDDPVLFTLDGKPHHASDLSPRLGLARYQMEFEHHFKASQLVADAVFEAHVANLAAETGREPDVVRGELLTVAPPTDAEVEALYAANRERIGAPLEQVRSRIEQFVVAQRQQARKQELVAALAEDGRFVTALVEPQPPQVDIASDGFPARGAATPKVTIVEFADFQCPFCRIAAGLLDELVKSHPDDLRVVFIDFPINPSGISRRVAFGAVCADRQGRYWDYHDLAFERQRQLDAQAATTLATTLGLDMTAFESCLHDPATAERVARAESEALRLGLDSTPSLFMNGRRLILQDLEKDLPRVVEQALGAS